MWERRWRELAWKQRVKGDAVKGRDRLRRLEQNQRQRWYGECHGSVHAPGSPLRMVFVRSCTGLSTNCR